MKRSFAERYAAMSDEQLEYEARTTYGLVIDARVAMRREMDKRGLAYGYQLSESLDGVQTGDGQPAYPQRTLGQFVEKHPILSAIVFLIIMRVTYKLLSTSFGG